MTELKRDNLVRASHASGTIALRAADDGGTGRTMFGHAAVFNRWTEIDSWFEGQFMERIAPGAFRTTLKDRAGQIRVMYAHGRHPSIGDMPIGAPDVLREDKIGLYYESELFDNSYANDIIAPLRADQLGASFRFSVDDETIVAPKKASADNPKMLEERTINAVSLFEIGPCPWGAYEDATAGVRSGTDQFLESFMNDPVFVARFTERNGIRITEKVLAQLPADGRRRAGNVPADGGSEPTRTSALLAVQRARMALTPTP